MSRGRSECAEKYSKFQVEKETVWKDNRTENIEKGTSDGKHVPTVKSQVTLVQDGN